MKPNRDDASCAGKSIIEMLWDELLEAYGELLGVKADNDRRRNGAHDLDEGAAEDEAALKGQCLGLATALAYMTNPYRVDVDAIRAEIAERYAALTEQQEG